jgi:hypothetical protein
MTSFVEFLFGAIVDDGALRSLRHLNLERNHFGISDVAAIVSLLGPFPPSSSSSSYRPRRCP